MRRVHFQMFDIKYREVVRRTRLLLAILIVMFIWLNGFKSAGKDGVRTNPTCEVQVKALFATGCSHSPWPTWLTEKVKKDLESMLGKALGPSSGKKRITAIFMESGGNCILVLRQRGASSEEIERTAWVRGSTANMKFPVLIESGVRALAAGAESRCIVKQKALEGWNLIQGKCVDGLAHGFGVAWSTGTDGPIYEGEFFKGLFHGQGMEVLPESPMECVAGYVGQWRNGKRHGIGTFVWLGGEKYMGHWLDDKPNGHGVSTSTKGYMYVGQFQHGEKHGLGMSIWPWGNIYVGHFKKSDMNGQGTLTKPDGSTLTGTWKDGECVKQTSQ